MPATLLFPATERPLNISLGNGQAGVAEHTWKTPLTALLRQRGFLPKSEREYCECIGRFVQWMQPRAAEAATEADIAAFLNALANQPNASRTAQKRALNAVLFFIRDVVGRPLADIQFERAAPVRVAAIELDHFELERLARQMDGATAVIAELASLPALRLPQVVRFRIQHIDMERFAVRLYTGKAERYRFVPLPTDFRGMLEEHLARLRRLHALDRAAKLAGVPVPNAVAAADPHAGESFEWQWLSPARDLSIAPDGGAARRRHVTELAFDRSLRQAGLRARITKPITVQLIRRSLAARSRSLDEPQPSKWNTELSRARAGFHALDRSSFLTQGAA